LTKRESCIDLLTLEIELSSLGLVAWDNSVYDMPNCCFQYPVCTAIVSTDLHSRKLEIARDSGADVVHNSREEDHVLLVVRAKPVLYKVDFWPGERGISH
jgi:hypothetical protein